MVLNCPEIRVLDQIIWELLIRHNLHFKKGLYILISFHSPTLSFQLKLSNNILLIFNNT